MYRILTALIVAMMAAAISVEGLMSLEELKQSILEKEKGCVAETQATDADVADLHAAKIPATTSGKCMAACMYKKTGMIKDGKYSPEGLMESSRMFVAESDPMMPKIQKMSTECAPASNDECELAAQLMECHIQFTKAEGLPLPI